MEVTELRIEVITTEETTNRLLACFSVLFDNELAVHGIKLIMGNHSRFVAMPAEKCKDRCPRCHKKNQLEQLFCGWCGLKLDETRLERWLAASPAVKPKPFTDIVHPISAPLRQKLELLCNTAYEQEVRQPGSIKPLLSHTRKRHAG